MNHSQISVLEPHQRQLGQLRACVAFLLSNLPTPTDQGLLQRIRDEIDQLSALAAMELDSPIALLGESGAGKSSLLNALLGMDLLPHNAGSAVTAAVCEIRGGAHGYRFEAALQSREEFIRRFSAVWNRLREAADDLRAAAAEGVTILDLDEYDRRLLESVTGLSAEDCASRPGLKDIFLPDVQDALRGDAAHTWEFMADEVDQLRDIAHLYLSSARPLWPLVNGVKIQGNFGVLQEGVRFVDVPGLNDPDPLRDRIARAHLERCKLVWIVLNGKRAATKEIVRYLAESRILTKLQLDGRLGSVAVVVTHADQYDDQALIKQHRLSDDATLDELLQKHRANLRGTIHDALLKVWDETVKQASGQVEQSTVAAGREALRSIPVFSVDSQQSILLRRITKSKKAPSFESDEQTGIPELQRWIVSEFARRERDAHRHDVQRRIERLTLTIRHEFGGRKDVKTALATLRGSSKGGIAQIRKDAATFLAARLAEHKTQKEVKAKSQAAVVIQAVHNAMTEADSMVQKEIPDRLHGVHWSTLRAIVRRGGVFNGSTRRWDLPEEIAALITSKVVFRWAELFEGFARSFAEELESRSSDLLAQHRQLLFQAIRSRIGVAGEESLRLPTSTGSLAFEFDLAQAHLNQQLDTARRRFASSLVESLRRELKPAFDAASDESGSGMKRRIIERLTASLADCVPELIPALARDLEERVHEVIHMLLGQVREVHARVRQIADRDGANIEVDIGETPEAELRRQIGVLDSALGMLERLN